MDTSNPYKIKEWDHSADGRINPLWQVTGPGAGHSMVFLLKKEAMQTADYMFSAYVAGITAGQKSVAPHLF